MTSTQQSSVPLRDPIASPRRPIGVAAVEQILAMVSAIGGLVWGLQSVPALIQQAPELDPVWTVPTACVIYLGLSLVWLAALARRYRRMLNTAFAVVLLIAIATWPLVTPADMTQGERPWLWQLLNVGTACAAIGMSAVLATAYAILVPALFSLITLLPSGGDLDLSTAILDAGYAIIIGLALVVMITSYRAVGRRVDQSQSEALASYVRAARAEAAETERREVDVLIHDSVLTSLISASKASDPEQRRLAVRMATVALAHLDEAEAPPQHDGVTSFLQLRARLSAALDTLGPTVTLATAGPMIGTMPVMAAEAMYSATLQAVFNSVQHAGDHDRITRAVRMHATAEGVLTISVQDNGDGFDPATVSGGRMGIRLSITERVRSVGGSVMIDSAPGSGTSVTLVWPASGRLRDEPDRTGSEAVAP